VREQPVSGRLEGGRGQGAVQIRLVEPDHAAAGRGRVGAQPAEGQLVRDGEQNQGVGGLVPVTDEVGVGDGEVESRVDRLASLCGRR
jgi:hypothetical protein